MRLKELTDRIAFKRLVATELPHHGSHQHELHGVAAFRRLLGTRRDTSGELRWLCVDEHGRERTADGRFHFYDARANTPDRTEWRLYYTGEFLVHASPGDLLILMRKPAGGYVATIVPGECRLLTSLLRILGMEDPEGDIEGCLSAAL